MFKNETKNGYVLALLDIAKEEKKLKEFYEQSNIIIQCLEENKEFENILDSFSIDENTKIKIIDKTFKNVDVSLLNVMKLLCLKNKFRYLREILNNLSKHIQDILNIKQGIIYSVNPLVTNDIKKLESKLERKYKFKIKLKNLIDKELIGGFRIELGTLIIEDSIKSELELMKTTLKIKKEVHS